MIFTAIHTKQFEKDIEKLKRMGDKNLIQKFTAIYSLLLHRDEKTKQLLITQYKDHLLEGECKQYRELHVKHDWLIMYKVDTENCHVIFVRTGTHSDLFS